MEQLLANKIKCPDGTVLTSKHRHDFQMHVQEDGREYFIDGGLAYQRIGFSDQEFEDLSCYVGDDHGKIRDLFEWTRRMDADDNLLEQPEVVLLKDITDAHLEALIVWTAEGYPEYIHQLFLDEKCWRNR